MENNRRSFFKKTAIAGIGLGTYPSLLRAAEVTSTGTRAAGGEISIMDFGAIPDSTTMNTSAIQAAIDKCNKAGGGTVIVPAGIYLTGCIFLKDNVCLRLEKGAELRGSQNVSDYPPINRESQWAYEPAAVKRGERALIYALKVHNASIEGKGVINGQGDFLVGESLPDRPYLIMFNLCTQISIRNITLKNSCFWTLRLLGGSGIIISGITIYSHKNLNNDGIDIDSRDVLISDCIIDSDDDAICFKSNRMLPCENVVVTNCVIASNCAHIKFGTPSFGGFRNITINNCVLRRASEDNHRHWNKTTRGIATGVTDPISSNVGITLQINDGGHMENINISDIVMEGIQIPISLTITSRQNPTGSMKNIQINNVIANNCSMMPSRIRGVPGFKIENVKISNCIFNMMGKGGIYSHDTKVPEAESLLAFGFFIRHVRAIQLVNLQFNLLNPDNRPAIWMEEGNSIYADNITLTGPSLAPDAFFLRNISDAWIQGFRTETAFDNFLYIDGENSSDIRLTNNDFSRVKKVYTAGSVVKKKNIVITMGNIQAKKAK